MRCVMRPPLFRALYDHVGPRLQKVANLPATASSPDQVLSLSAPSNSLGAGEVLEGLDQYAYLCMLSLQFNRLTSLASQVFPKTLIHLNVAGNELTSLDGLELPHLLWLDASDNQITDPPDMRSLPQLCEARLSGNRLTSLQRLERAQNLNTLLVDGNKISSFMQLRPLSMCKSLRHLALAGNPLPPLLVGRRGHIALRNLLPELATLDGRQLPGKSTYRCASHQLHLVGSSAGRPELQRLNSSASTGCADAEADSSAQPSVSASALPPEFVERVLAALEGGSSQAILPPDWAAPKAAVHFVGHAISSGGHEMSASGRLLADPSAQPYLRNSWRPLPTPVHLQAQFCGMLPKDPARMVRPKLLIRGTRTHMLRTQLNTTLWTPGAKVQLVASDTRSGRRKDSSNAGWQDDSHAWTESQDQSSSQASQLWNLEVPQGDHQQDEGQHPEVWNLEVSHQQDGDIPEVAYYISQDLEVPHQQAGESPDVAYYVGEGSSSLSGPSTSAPSLASSGGPGYDPNVHDAGSDQWRFTILSQRSNQIQDDETGRMQLGIRQIEPSPLRFTERHTDMADDPTKRASHSSMKHGPDEASEAVGNPQQAAEPPAEAEANAEEWPAQLPREPLDPEGQGEPFGVPGFNLASTGLPREMSIDVAQHEARQVEPPPKSPQSPAQPSVQAQRTVPAYEDLDSSSLGEELDATSESASSDSGDQHDEDEAVATSDRKTSGCGDYYSEHNENESSTSADRKSPGSGESSHGQYEEDLDAATDSKTRAPSRVQPRENTGANEGKWSVLWDEERLTGPTASGEASDLDTLSALELLAKEDTEVY